MHLLVEQVLVWSSSFRLFGGRSLVSLHSPVYLYWWSASLGIFPLAFELVNGDLEFTKFSVNGFNSLAMGDHLIHLSSVHSGRPCRTLHGAMYCRRFSIAASSARSRYGCALNSRLPRGSVAWSATHDILSVAILVT